MKSSSRCGNLAFKGRDNFRWPVLATVPTNITYMSQLWISFFYISLLLEKNWEGPTKLGFLPWQTCCKKRQIQSLRPFTSNIESYYNFRMNSRNRCPLKFWTTFPVLTKRNAFCVKTNFRATSQVKSTRIIVRFITLKIVVSMWIKEVGNNW